MTKHGETIIKFELTRDQASVATVALAEYANTYQPSNMTGVSEFGRLCAHTYLIISDALDTV
jgi:hypothetical protein